MCLNGDICKLTSEIPTRARACTHTHTYTGTHTQRKFNLNEATYFFSLFISLYLLRLLCGVHVFTCACAGSERSINVRCLPQFLSTRSITEPGAQFSWAVSPRDPPVSASPALGLPKWATPLWSHPGPQACAADT